VTSGPRSLVTGAGAATAVGAVAALALGVVAAPVGIALAAAGAVASIAALADRGRPRAPKAPAAPPPPDYAAQLDALEASVRGKVPPAVEARVQRVTATLRDTLPRLDQIGAGSHQAHAAVQTATSYLPEAVGAYLRLPRSFADRRPVSGGRTPLMVLCDQLDLLAGEMDEVFVAVCRADADALVAHGRFLEEKFGAGSALTLEQGPTP
jgi:hypothetical protein